MSATAASATSTITITSSTAIPEIEAQKNPTSIIVGMGAAGLPMAKGLLEAGHRVILIDNRADFTRWQRFVLSPYVFNQLFKMSSLPKLGVTLSSNLGSENTTYRSALICPPTLNTATLHGDLFYQCLCKEDLPSIKDLQTFLLNILKSSPLKDNLTIYQGPQFEITQIEGDKQTILLKDDKTKTVEEIPFHYFIAADGVNSAKRGMAHLLAKNPKYKIPYVKLPETRHSTCGSIEFKLKANTNLPDSLPKTLVSPIEKESALTPEHLPQLKKLAWDKEHLPISYIARDENNVFYLIGEMPSNMAPNDMTAREEWAKFILSVEFKKYGLSEKDFQYLPTQHSAKNPLFKLDLEVAQTNVIALGKKGGFFVIGDARQNPNFFYGHGVEDAMSDASTLFRCFKEAQLLPSALLNLKDVLAHHRDLIEDYRILHENFLKALHERDNASKNTAKITNAANTSDAPSAATQSIDALYLAKSKRIQAKNEAWVKLVEQTVACAQEAARKAQADLEKIVSEKKALEESIKKKEESAEMTALNARIREAHISLVQVMYDKMQSEQKSLTERWSASHHTSSATNAAATAPTVTTVTTDSNTATSTAANSEQTSVQTRYSNIQTQYSKFIEKYPLPLDQYQDTTLEAIQKESDTIDHELFDLYWKV